MEWCIIHQSKLQDRDVEYKETNNKCLNKVMPLWWYKMC